MYCDTRDNKPKAVQYGRIHAWYEEVEANDHYQQNYSKLSFIHGLWNTGITE